MTVSTAAMIAWMQARKGNVSYSMDHRDGPDSYDCSSAIYYAGISGGMSELDWACSTETEHAWLEANEWECIAENEEFDCQYGDIFIWGQKGYSAGAFGHTGIFLDTEGTIIHCNYPDDGIGIAEHDDLWMRVGQPYYYCYRYKGAPATTPNPAQTEHAVTQFEQEIANGVSLQNSPQPYFEATVSGDYWVEAHPFSGAEEKELFKKGTRVRVYEKVNGYSRVGSPQSYQWIEDKVLTEHKDL